jgi:hypothetical protein
MLSPIRSQALAAGTGSVIRCPVGYTESLNRTDSIGSHSGPFRGLASMDNVHAISGQKRWRTAGVRPFRTSTISGRTRASTAATERDTERRAVVAAHRRITDLRRATTARGPVGGGGTTVGPGAGAAATTAARTSPGSPPVRLTPGEVVRRLSPTWGALTRARRGAGRCTASTTRCTPAITLGPAAPAVGQWHRAHDPREQIPRGTKKTQ